MMLKIEDFEKLLTMAQAANGRINKIYLHWTAGRHQQPFNDYHLCINGEGHIDFCCKELTERKSHTWRRNTGAIGIALECCYGAGISLDNNREPVINWGPFPPTEIQIVAMAKAVAVLCYGLGLEVSGHVVMTHAEVAEEDKYSIYDTDPDLRWDLLKLPMWSGGGGDIIRNLATTYLDSIKNNSGNLARALT